MPVHRVKGGFQWGNHGHVYPTREGAERQARAIYANGYRGYEKGGLVSGGLEPPRELGRVRLPHVPTLKPAFMKRNTF